MKPSVNLLPWKCRKAQLIRLRLASWSVVWAVVGGLVAAAGFARWDQCSASRGRAEQLEQAYAPTSALLAEIRTLGRGVEQQRARETVVAQLESPRPALTLLGLVSRSARECEGRLRVEQLSVASSQLSVGSGQRTTDNRQLSTDNYLSATSVTIKGIAADDLAVARFVVALRQTKAFDRVELKSSQEQPARDHPANLRNPGTMQSMVADGARPDGARRTRSYMVECGY